MSRKEKSPRVDIYARITDRIVAELEKGVRPWTQPWHSNNAVGRVTRPLRHNGLPYSGMNVLLLWSEAIARGFTSPIWMTFKQALELGGAVRKGETGSMVVFASRFTRTEADAAGQEVDREIPFLKAYFVFNIAQIDGLPDYYCEHNAEPMRDPVPRIERADRFFANTGAVIRHGGDSAYFSPATDHIQMPPLQTFRDAEAYVATLSHEATHWTSAPRRVNRDLSRYGKDRSERAREELIAELGSCFLCADLGIAPELEPRPDHASYLDSWLRVLADDKRAIFSAAAHAQRAVAFLHSLQPAASDEREAAPDCSKHRLLAGRGSLALPDPSASTPA
ncbi:ArdC family protein [Mesorhizobium sp. CO1-1-8]|uniref:ArdC family protein n=1 Tax=Mesorhizobium sp. CO1-1-8 TaxID=2876631 RepID=UPI001CD1527A|nr:zincin-like metallopeptidase domain-containing protein [Mesorhizobium sp. CO1-1-8]MBZ9772339.1 ssDNA-binding domain-containing protein [Mesorhizobium sp. CO1-1-8]